MVERLSGILGQERAVGLLRRYLSSGAVPQGLLFSGEEGIGKEKAARVFAAAILCRAPGEDGACGDCPDCRLHASSSHPNFLRIVPETDFLKIDEIRALQEELALKAFSDRPRVAILVPAERMTPQAANALLKTLEEPPPETHLLLVTHRVAGMMPTIVSRCQKVPFFPLPPEEAARILSLHPEAGGKYPPGILQLACAVAGGSPGRALVLLPDIEEERGRWLSVFTGGSPVEAVALADTFRGEGDEPGRLAAPLSLARDLALLSSGGGTAIMNDDLRVPLTAAAVRPPTGGWDTAFRALLAISRMPPQPQKRLLLEAFFFGMRKKG